MYFKVAIPKVKHNPLLKVTKKIILPLPKQNDAALNLMNDCEGAHKLEAVIHKSPK